MSTTTNGRARPQLADEITRMTGQLDRMDVVLDGLSEALNEACHDAAKEGTRLAVKQAVIALLSDPDLRTALHIASAPPPADAPPSPWARLKAAARRAAVRVKVAVVTAAAVVGHRVSQAVAAVGRVVARVRASGPVRTAVKVLATVVGVPILAKTGAARRVVALADRVRVFVTERLTAGWCWLRTARLQMTGG
jgi:hypothetical protein